MAHAVCQFPAPFETMNLQGKFVACRYVRAVRRTNRASGQAPLRCAALQAGQRLPYVEAEARVERKRSIVKSRLHQANARRAAFARAVKDNLHEVTAYARVLARGIDSDWPHTGDDGTFIETVGSDNAAVGLG